VKTSTTITAKLAAISRDSIWQYLAMSFSNMGIA
jgi:hypothetical protein